MGRANSTNTQGAFLLSLTLLLPRDSSVYMLANAQDQVGPHSHDINIMVVPQLRSELSPQCLCIITWSCHTGMSSLTLPPLSEWRNRVQPGTSSDYMHVHNLLFSLPYYAARSLRSLPRESSPDCWHTYCFFHYAWDPSPLPVPFSCCLSVILPLLPLSFTQWP